MLHAERFFMSSVKLCVDIPSSLQRGLCFSWGGFYRPPLRQTLELPMRLWLRHFCLSSRCFRFEYLDLGLGLALRGRASVFGFLQLCLNLGVELVDLLVQLCLVVGMSLGVFCLYLGEVGLHRVDLLFVGGFPRFRQSAAEHRPADRLHAGVHGRSE